MICAACGQPITDEERVDAVCWLDPRDVACVAHGPCLEVYDAVLARFAAGEA